MIVSRPHRLLWLPLVSSLSRSCMCPKHQLRPRPADCLVLYFWPLGFPASGSATGDANRACGDPQNDQQEGIALVPLAVAG